MHQLLQRLEDRTARVAVLGQGYVGLLVSMRASEAGFPVVGLEADEERAASLAAGRSYVGDVPDDVLAASLVRGYRATSSEGDVAGFDVAVITVPTPLHEGQPDVSHIEAAATTVGRHLRPRCLVVLESTTYPGTTEEVVGPALEEASGLQVGRDFLLGYSPERIDPGNPEFGLANTPKVVSGIDADSLAAVEGFYGAFVEKLVAVGTVAEAELVKLLENTFRHVNIALVNELAMFAHQLGVDIWAAIDAAATKPFGFMAFRPGPGVGGHCLPVDPSYLSWRVKRRLGETFRFVELANDVNDHMPAYVVRRVQRMLNRDGLAVKGAQIAVLGYAYKAGTSDARETPAAPIIDGLLDLGAEVVVIDAHVSAAELDSRVDLLPFSPEALSSVAAVVLVTDHPDFDYDVVASASRRVLDTRNRLGALGGTVERL